MKPPPPIPHDAGFVTPTASAVATAASTAFPPCFNISSPAPAAGSLSDTTIPCVPTAELSGDESAAKDSEGTENEIASAMAAAGRMYLAETRPPPERNITRFTNSHRRRMKDGTRYHPQLDFATPKCFDHARCVCGQALRSRRLFRTGGKKMNFAEIIYEKKDRVATLTMNRPEKMNAWTPKMGAEMRTAMMDAERDPEVGAILVTGAGR